MENSLIVTALSLSLLFFVWLKHYSSRSSLPVPPGPKGLPLLGNVFDIPSSMPWKAFRDLSITYVPTQKILVLNSAQATLDLLEKRSDIYSSRIPRLMNDIVFPTPWAFVLMEYSKLWRTHRREFHHHFHKEVVHNYRPIQLRQCRSFLQRVLDDSGRLGQHIRLIYSAIILKIVYDMDVNDMDHKYVQIVEEVVTTLSVAQVPGKFWVEFVPILRHIPSWVPGAYFKRWAEQVRPVVNQMINLPFDDVKRNMAAGKAGPSVAAAIIESMQADEKATAMWKEREEIARGVTAVTYAAATDTTTGAAQTFFMAMSLFPHVQRKAQEELDRVVGPSRLPEFDDFDNLVYIQAVILESLRWMPVLPMGIPHALIRDDEYRGYFIPKGTMVIANIWAMLRDPEDYPDPENFNPDRFIKDGRINPDVRDPGTIAFGFGRRVCPGKWLSSGSLFMTIASVLHTLDIHPILEPDGKKYDPFNHRIDGINLTVKDVPCTVTPRSESAERLIRQWASLS